MQCAVLLCRLTVGDSSPPKDMGGQLSVISGQWSKGRRQHPPWEGEAPAEPKSIVSVQLSLFALNRSPGIPARPPFTHIKPRRGARLTVAQPFRGLITTQQRATSASSPRWCSMVVAWASACIVHRVQAPPTQKGEPLAEADGCCCLRLSCYFPDTEAVSCSFFSTPSNATCRRAQDSSLIPKNVRES